MENRVDCVYLLAAADGFVQVNGKMGLFAVRFLMLRDGKILDTPWQWPSGKTGDLGSTVDMGAPHAVQLSEQPLRPGRPLAVILGQSAHNHHIFKAFVGYFCFCFLLFCFETGSH